MTTTIVFSGKEGKNSSKVLAPPGGASSNIFGHYEEEAPAPQRRQQQQQRSTLFDHDPAPAQATGPAKPFKPKSSFNIVTGEPCDSPQQRSQPQQQQQSPMQQPPQQQATPPQAAPQQQSSMQPRGASSEVVKPSVKIYNPPGGKSSIQF